MRYYNTRQAEMLNYVSMFLKKEQDKLTKKVPALKDFITKFIEMEDKIYHIIIGNPNVVLISTIEKKQVRDALIIQTVKLISMLKAAHYTFKDKPIAEMHYTLYGLKKLSADKLCKAHLKIYNAARKIKNRLYYGISEEDMKDMRAYYSEFTAVKKTPALKKKEKAIQHKNLARGVKECIEFLEDHIDSLMFIAAEDDSALQYSYKMLRQVLPRGPGRISDAEAAYRKSREKKQE